MEGLAPDEPWISRILMERPMYKTKFLLLRATGSTETVTVRGYEKQPIVWYLFVEADEILHQNPTLSISSGCGHREKQSSRERGKAVFRKAATEVCSSPRFTSPAHSASTTHAVREVWATESGQKSLSRGSSEVGESVLYRRPTKPLEQSSWAEMLQNEVMGRTVPLPGF
jgi:hypothetical protein